MIKIATFVLGILNTNTYIVFDENTGDAFIVDPGDEAPEILDFVSSRGLRVRAIVATHGHFDHVLGADYLRNALGVEFYMHKEDINIAQESMMWLSKPNKLFPLRPDQLIESDTELKLGSLDIKIFHTPGHTPGSICIYVRDQKMLFSGDTIFYESVGRTDLPGGSEEDLMNSIRKIYTNTSIDTIVYPGHGPTTSLKHELTSNMFVRLAMRL